MYRFHSGATIILTRASHISPEIDVDREEVMRKRSAGARSWCLLAVGMLLSSVASVHAQVYTDPYVVPAIGEEYFTAAPTVVPGVPVRVMPRRVVIKQRRRVVMRPAVTVIPPVVTETRVIRPAPVIEQRIVQPRRSYDSG